MPRLSPRGREALPHAVERLEGDGDHAVEDLRLGSLAEVELVDAAVGPERLAALLQVLQLSRVDRAAQHVKVEGAEQVMSPLLVVDVQMVEDENVGAVFERRRQARRKERPWPWSRQEGCSW